ncbi:MAG TPA: dienelactone hydrolase family protein [Burkholderiales bacterium]|jgi:carboxymethylenebutenolidase|nr:dienelactone hydrolase family protein [Burkholderiales bacterium]
MANKLNESTVTIETDSGPMEAFQVIPEGVTSAPALVIAQEAFGVNTHIRDVARRFAREGYAVLAPDMYHRTGKMLTYAYDDPKRREPFSALTNEGIEIDINAALAHLGKLPEVDAGRIGIVGFCVGGFMAFLAACRTDVATAVCFYGGGIVNHRDGLKLEPLLTEAANIKVPVLMLFGEKDTSIPQAEVDAIRNRVGMQPREHEVVVYPGAEHGFFCDERSSYKADAADDAWKRTVKWLELRLKALQNYPTED